MKRSDGLILAGMLLFGWATSAGAQTLSREKLRFEPVGTNEFRFDTGLLKGKLRAGGKSKGLSEVVHIPSGLRIDASMGLLSHYRVFTVNKRYGSGAWDWPSEAISMPDGSVLVRWPAAEDRPFELHAHYRLAAPDTIDVETSVMASTNLPGFESFLACYFSAAFTNSLVNVTNAGGKGTFMAAVESNGVWQVFLRDDQALNLVKDGRWTHPPSPVDWAVMPQLQRFVGIRRAPASEVTAVLMARPAESFALFTPHQAEPHYSMYVGQIGHTLDTAGSASARVRLVIRAGLKNAEAGELYDAWAGKR